MMTQVSITPALLTWARTRAGLSVAELESRFPRFRRWELGEASPTLNQVEELAKVTHTPVGYLFLPAPPVERLPIPDLRTVANEHVARPSPNLLAMIHVCQERQAWYREFARGNAEPERSFVGSARTNDGAVEVAAAIAARIGFDVDARGEIATWTDALRELIAQAESAGVLVMCSGVVLNNNSRKLDPQEFRGFALADALAPLVFINGADTKAAQMFTLAHELAHLWLGQSGVTDAEMVREPQERVERWCNRVAAELLVPMAKLRQEFRAGDLGNEVTRLARRFKVSTLVVLRRLHDDGKIGDRVYRDAYESELRKAKAAARKSGGNFYLTQGARASKRFVRALVASTREGQTLYRDAFRMLGISKTSTFDALGRNLDR